MLQDLHRSSLARTAAILNVGVFPDQESNSIATTLRSYRQRRATTATQRKPEDVAQVQEDDRDRAEPTVQVHYQRNEASSGRAAILRGRVEAKVERDPVLADKIIPSVGYRRPTAGNGCLEALVAENTTCFTDPSAVYPLQGLLTTKVTSMR